MNRPQGKAAEQQNRQQVKDRPQGERQIPQGGQRPRPKKKTAPLQEKRMDPAEGGSRAQNPEGGQR